MPKVISRSTISTSDGTSASSSTPLRVFYCLCGDFILVCDTALSSLPTRPLDGSHVLRVLDSPPDAQTGRVKPKRVFKINAKQGREAVILKREDGTLEKQWRFHCARCELPVGYEVTPPPLKSGKFTYILPGALTETQGQPPPNALLEDQLAAASASAEEEQQGQEQAQEDDSPSKGEEPAVVAVAS